MGEKVGDSVGGTSDVFQSVVEVLEEFYPSRLSAGYFLQFMKVLEILVVREHSNWVFSPEEERMAAFESKDYTSEFLIVDVVVLFGREETSRMECDGVHSVCMFLGDHHTKSIARCIGVHDERFGPVRGFQNWFACTDLFQILEGCFTFIGPVPLLVLACEVI